MEKSIPHHGFMPAVGYEVGDWCAWVFTQRNQRNARIPNLLAAMKTTSRFNIVCLDFKLYCFLCTQAKAEASICSD
jgi:hypothetical protein